MVGLTVGFWLSATWTSSAVSADTPVLVLAADDVILRLPVSPDVRRITTDLAVELNVAASNATDDRIAGAFRAWSEDDRLLQRVASTPVEMFDSGEAVATATAIYDIQVSEDIVVVIVSTVELVPGYGSTAISRDHEDGHALINRAIARRCASEVLEDSVNKGRRGGSLVNEMILLLTQANRPVHTSYHTYVRRAGYGQHIGFAERAVEDVVGCG
jgi:hypothetical protein